MKIAQAGCVERAAWADDQGETEWASGSSN
jgi:hypothetical protein